MVLHTLDRRATVRTLLFSLLALTLATGRAAAQADARARVAGVVVDSSTGQPIVAAHVRLLPGHMEELTHSDGRFVLEGLSPGSYTLVVEQLGYRSATRDVDARAGATSEHRIALAVSAIHLGEIVVTGTFSPRSRDEVLSPVATVAGAELDRRVSETVAAMLENKPGLAATSLGPVTGRPIIRGLGGDRILVLEDGQRMGDLSSMSSDHAVATDPLTARQIEVVRGPMSLLYGSSALGGVINVVRDEIPTTLPHEAHGVLSVQGQTVNDGLTGGGSATAGFGRFAVRLEASARRSADLSTPIGRLVNTDAQTFDVGGGVGLPVSWGHAGAAYRFYANDYGIPGGFVGGHATGVEISMRRHVARGAIELHTEDGFLQTLSLDGGYTNYHHTEFEPSGAIGTTFGQDLIQSELVGMHGARGVLSEGAFGVRGHYRDIATGGTLRTPSTYDFALAGFLIEEVGRDPLRLQVGVRYDWAHYVPRDTTSFISAGGERIPVRARTFGNVSASIGVLGMLSSSVRAGASVARAYRTPDFNELYSNGPHLAANSFDVGDPALDSETGLGVDLFLRISRDRFAGEFAAFYNTLSGYIFPSSRGRAESGAQGGRPRFQYTNEDARFRGVEGELAAALTDWLQLEASGSLVYARFTSDRAPIPVIDGADTTFVPASKYPPLIPPPSGRIGVRFERPGRFAGAGLRLVARQERLGDFETVTPGYALPDLTAGIRVVRGSMLHTITLRIDNLFNTEYRDHLSRTKDIMPVREGTSVCCTDCRSDMHAGSVEEWRPWFVPWGPAGQCNRAVSSSLVRTRRRIGSPRKCAERHKNPRGG
jgi:iron complex outermembrane receptor protein